MENSAARVSFYTIDRYPRVVCQENPNAAREYVRLDLIETPRRGSMRPPGELPMEFLPRPPPERTMMVA
jgi:hypothetical protein